MSKDNLYRIGDDVYFESNFSTPYHIKRIEELKKTPAGSVVAKVRCYYRRRDLPNTLLTIADKYLNTLESENNIELTVIERQQLKCKELFLTRKTEIVSVKQFRGKCLVTLFNEVEPYYSYLFKEDAFFYCLVYDPYIRILQPDKGEIRVGNRYQADIPELIKDVKQENRNPETIIWTPNHNLSDKQIDQFLVTSRSIGTFARALHSTNSIQQPNLYMNAAAASRDISIFHAMDTLHNNQYSIPDAISSLIPSNCHSVLCRDEMEDWSSFEANQFEEALETYGKKFHDIREDFLPWKSVKNLIEYYYMWKTSERYIQQKRIKELKSESKLNEICIPVVYKMKNNDKMIDNKPCESCGISTTQQWFSGHPGHKQIKLCQECWNHWKKYGGFKNLSIGFDPEKENFQMENCSESFKEETMPTMHMTRRRYKCSIVGCGMKFKVKDQLLRHYSASHGLSMKNRRIQPDKRSCFYLSTTVLTKLSRRLCKKLLAPRHAARSPFLYINTQAIKVNCRQKITGKTITELSQTFLKKTRKKRGSVTVLASKLALSHNFELIVPEWLQIINRKKVSFSKTKQNSMPYETILILKNESKILPDELNRTYATPINLNKYEAITSPLAVVHETPASSNIKQNTRTNYKKLNEPNGSYNDISHSIVPNDMYFKSNQFYKNARQLISLQQLKSVARKPCKEFT